MCMLIIGLIISFNLKNLDYIKKQASKTFLLMDIVLEIMMIKIRLYIIKNHYQLQL